MRHWRWLVLVAVCACSSKKPDEPPAPAPPPPPIAEPVLGDQPFTLPFVIDQVDEHQKPTDEAPWHAAGGDWTFLAVHLPDDPAARFGLLVETTNDAFGKMVLAPTTADAGARVVAAYAKTFLLGAPPAVIPGGTLKAMPVSLAMLGTQLGHGAGGFGGAGSWTATKMFCATAGEGAAELFVNWSVVEKRGELSQKDGDYDQDISRCLATALRDGATPPRTPATDPTLDPKPVQVVVGAKVGSDHARVCGQTATRAVLADDEAILAFDVATGKSTRLFAADAAISDCACDTAATTCAFAAGAPEGKVLVLHGGAVAPSAVEHGENLSVSPDGAWIVSSTDGGIDAFAPGQPVKAHVALPRPSFTIVFGWLTVNGHTVVKLWHDNANVDTPTRAALRWDLQGAPDKLTASADELPFGDYDRESGLPTSPDGSRRFQIADGTLTITPLPAGAPRTLAFHPEDADAAHPGCCTWIDSRYLAFTRGGGAFAFIDTDAMKLSVMAGPRASLEVAPDMAHGFAYRMDDGLYVATIRTRL